MTISRNLQEVADRLTYDMFIDCDNNAVEAARQLGVSPATVRARVRRASIRYGGGNRYNRNTVADAARTVA